MMTWIWGTGLAAAFAYASSKSFAQATGMRALDSSCRSGQRRRGWLDLILDSCSTGRLEAWASFLLHMLVLAVVLLLAVWLFEPLRRLRRLRPGGKRRAPARAAR